MADRLLDIFIELTVRKMGLGMSESDAFTQYPDFKIVDLVLENTLQHVWPDVALPSLEVIKF